MNGEKVEEKLRKFDKIPIFIVANHNDALRFIYRQIGAKYLPFQGATILHFDSHPDLLLPLHMPAMTVYDKSELFAAIDIENWLLPAAYAGHITQIIWIKPQWAQQIMDGFQNFVIGEDKETSTIRLNCKENYFISESLYVPENQLNNKRMISLDVFTVGKSVDNGLVDDLGESKDLLKKYANTSVILDIDLDYFSTENPFMKMFSKASVYEKIKEIYRYLPPKSKSDQDIKQAIENRRKQLKDLSSIFNYLDRNYTLPPSLDVERNEIHRKITDLYGIIEQNFDVRSFNWDMLHVAGSTIDDSDLPHHKSTDSELDLMFKAFRDFLNCLTKPPIIITISRSNEDEYTPEDQVEVIQSKVLEILNETFQCDERIIEDYKNQIDPIVHLDNETVPRTLSEHNRMKVVFHKH